MSPRPAKRAMGCLDMLLTAFFVISVLLLVGVAVLAFMARQ